ncbi:LppX_LprAFG lipoprotein [Isoptericola sp. BMS4]|uniref:LppX_LprAFG lipoprotein n=1 Tax=Isoptericola sp. BMS4 TaxID=2527875 RepID=UPI001421E982|nr:LppX_LprAFG lipoprotein [Isoptericola sp. BMS4]
MRSIPLRRTWALAPAGLLTVGLSACVDGGSPQSLDSDRAAEMVVVEPASDAAELAEQMQAAQEKAGTTHMEMSYGGELADRAGMSGNVAALDASFTEQDAELRMSMDVMGMDMEVIVLDGTVYLAMPGQGEGTYVSLSFDEMAAEPMLAGPLESMESMDAAAQVEAMTGAVTSFEHTGTERVGGVDASLYTMTLDPSRLETVPAGLAALGGQAGETTVDYAVAPDGLPVEIEVTTEVNGEELVVESVFSRWGEPLDIEAPTDEDVMPYSDIAP